MSKINVVYVILGANLGNPISKFAEVRDLVERRIGHVIQHSSIYSSPGWGVEEEQPDYLNQIFVIETLLSAENLLIDILQIETDLGRVRHKKWDSRIIDLDILFYNEEVIETENLQIPHPLLHKRGFVLTPLMEINPDFLHPKLLKKISRLYEECADISDIKKI